FSLLVIILLGLVAALAPVLAPHDPYRWKLEDADLPPMWVHNPANPGMAEYPLGSDRFGRDILSRQLYGTRTAFFLALTAVPLAALIGTLIGLISGYAGGKVDAVIMFVNDTVQSLPGIMFMVIIILIFRYIFRPTWFYGLITLVVGFAAVSWVSLARLIRINVMTIKSQLFVEAAVSLGATPMQIIFRHLLPNVLHVIIVWIINNIPAVILLEAVLGYVGVGVTSAVDGSEFTVVSWGGIFFSGRSAMSRNPLMLIVPSVCILLISMSFFLLGDFLNESTRAEQE
ncbi:MAG: ABC transporter permease, partial [Anaerolineaceae bacterium]|nr:ABC transporter permease [Anaerolineaceae bacterium]